MKKNKNIHVSEFYKLISFTPNGQISTNDLNAWLQHQTEAEFAVIEKVLLEEAIKEIKDCSTTMNKINNEFEEKFGYKI